MRNTRRKIGIITLYHNSINYGGNLQAYALCKYLQNKGVYAEQIAFDATKRLHKESKFINQIIKLFEQGFVVAVNKVFSVIKTKLVNIPVDEIELQIRKKAFYKFSKEIIPHSDSVYTVDTLNECINDYDVFITGSDQVWNFAWYNSIYFLDFVDGTEKKKLSYAASFSMKELNDNQKSIVSNSLQDYTAISVREENAKFILAGVTDKNVTYVVDPTLLLKQEDWNDICEERIIDEKYVFGYFIGSNISVVRLAKEYAQQRNLKFVMIPFASGNYNIKEDGLSDIRVVDASPEKFLSLIKHAEYVFTDSFHAVVFSFIFKKQYFVFNRDAKGSMNSRITSLTDMFDMQERFCATGKQESLEYVEGLNDINYNRKFPKFEECREKSYEFIRKNILDV